MTVLARILLASTLVLFTVPAALRADNINIKPVGPISKDGSLDAYKIGKQRLKLKAFVVDSADGLTPQVIATAAARMRTNHGTNDWDWSIGYLSLHRYQALVLSWYNLDSKKHGWVAVRTPANGEWEVISNHKPNWHPFVNKNLMHHDTTNKHLVVTRFSKTGGSKIAYAFSRSAEEVDLEDLM